MDLVTRLQCVLEKLDSNLKHTRFITALGNLHPFMRHCWGGGRPAEGKSLPKNSLLLHSVCLTLLEALYVRSSLRIRDSL